MSVPKTAAQRMAELASNPDFVRRQEDRTLKRQLAVDRTRAAAVPVLKELEDVGIKVHAISEITGVSQAAYDMALPVLLRWLKPEVAELGQVIVSALSVPLAKPKAARGLLRAVYKR
jgi:hypothetical protein